MSDTPSAGRFDGREHVLPVRVYYEDTDFTGAVYHASYVRFLERGRSDFMRLAGVDHMALSALGTAFAVLSLKVDFHQAARIDDALEVRTLFEAARGARLHVRQRITRGVARFASAEVEVACIGSMGRPKRPPTALTAALRPFLR